MYRPSLSANINKYSHTKETVRACSNTIYRPICLVCWFSASYSMFRRFLCGCVCKTSVSQSRAAVVCREVTLALGDPSFADYHKACVSGERRKEADGSTCLHVWLFVQTRFFLLLTSTWHKTCLSFRFQWWVFYMQLNYDLWVQLKLQAAKWLT